eukprot:jgi/Tetstr1/437517/TSEL_026195.t1
MADNNDFCPKINVIWEGMLLAKSMLDFQREWLGPDGQLRHRLPGVGLAAQGVRVLDGAPGSAVFETEYVETCDNGCCATDVRGAARNGAFEFWKPAGFTASVIPFQYSKWAVKHATTVEEYKRELEDWSSWSVGVSVAGSANGAKLLASAAYTKSKSSSQAVANLEETATMESTMVSFAELISYEIATKQALLTSDLVRHLQHFASAISCADDTSELFQEAEDTCVKLAPAWYKDAQDLFDR